MGQYLTLSDMLTCCFSGENKVYYFQAETIQVLRQWIECLEKVVLAELPKFKYSVPS